MLALPNPKHNYNFVLVFVPDLIPNAGLHSKTLNLPRANPSFRELNNTWIYDEEAYCDDTVIWNDRICDIRRGSLFQENASKTFEKADDIAAAGGARTEVTYEGSEIGIKKLISTSLAGTDTLVLNGSDSLTYFPIGIPRLRWDSGYTMLHALGLGSNSTYLNALQSAGDLPSRVWSIFWGRMWIDNPIDGSVVLGGYDEEKVIGKNYTAPLDYDDYTGTGGCWTGMKVIVSDIRLNFRDGSDESIFPSSTALPVCLVPQRQLLLEAPAAYVNKFEEVTGINSTGSSYGLHWSARLFDADHVFDGDITFHLDSGLQIRVPNDQYIVPSVDIARNGSQIFKKGVKELLMNGLGSQPATLGRYFFTAAYLMVNHDAGTFTLWQANPSTKSALVRVFDEETASKCGGDATGIVQPSTSSTSTRKPEATQDADTEAKPSSSPSGLAIGGAVAGVVVAVAVIGLVAFYMIRRQKKQRLEYAAAISTSNQDPPKYHISSEPQELPNKGWYHPAAPPAEVQGQDHFVYEMPATPYQPRR
ncbi:Fc.00g009590.m01.CDS01 [Cosmosporella sp. VM-42]